MHLSREEQISNLKQIIERKEERIKAYTWVKHRMNEEINRLIDQRNIAEEELEALN